MKNLLLSLSLLLTTNIYANKANVLKVKTSCNTQNICSFKVSVKHNDTGWDHYANNFEILSMDRKILATRILHHPHVNEQPFTRSISNVKIPKNIKKVIVRAHDKVHGYGGKEVIVELN